MGKENEVFLGNYPIEQIQPGGEPDTSGVNFVAQRELNSGNFESVRMDKAFDENGNTIFGERAIFAVPKERTTFSPRQSL